MQDRKVFIAALATNIVKWQKAVPQAAMPIASTVFA